jgi:hypothetical protein
MDSEIIKIEDLQRLSDIEQVRKIEESSGLAEIYSQHHIRPSCVNTPHAMPGTPKKDAS